MKIKDIKKKAQKKWNVGVNKTKGNHDKICS